MSSIVSAIGRLLIALIAVMLVVSCKSSDKKDDTVCVPGDVISCTCEGSRESGTKKCARNGAKWFDCVCDPDTETVSDMETASETASNLDSASDSTSDSITDTSSLTDSDTSSDSATDTADVYVPPTCIQIDRAYPTVIEPSSLRVMFRVLDCEGSPVRPLTDTDVVTINMKSGAEFNAADEPGNASGPSVHQPDGLYSVLVLDMSNSIIASQLQNQIVEGAKAYVKKMVTDAPVGWRHQIAILAFGAVGATQFISDFTDDTAALNTALDGLLPGQTLGAAHLYDAWLMAVEKAKAQGVGQKMVERSVVVVTDGPHEGTDASTLRNQALNTRMSAAKNANMSLFTVSIKGDFEEKKIRELASKDAYYTQAETGAELPGILTKVATQMSAIAGSNYAVGVCTPVDSGVASVKLVVDVDGATTQSEIYYPTDKLTGDLTQCDAQIVANPCFNIACGPGAFPDVDCGACAGASEWCDNGACVDDCATQDCGTSLRGFNCGICKGATEICTAGKCVDDCATLECGVSPTGLECGACSGTTEICTAGKCVDDCGTRQCGLSPGNVDCGICATGTACDANGVCVNDCGARVCDKSPLGLNCGTCAPNTWCTAAGACVNDCGTRVCGESPLGGMCGTCTGANDYCSTAGACVDDCLGLQCGTSPTLGRSCGACSGSTPSCVNHQCVAPTIPDPLLYFSFDDNSIPVQDVSGNGYTGTLVNSPAYLPTGGYDGSGAYQFQNVKSCIEIGKDSSLQQKNLYGTDGYSLAIWIYPQATVDTGYYRILSRELGYVLYLAEGAFEFWSWSEVETDRDNHWNVVSIPVVDALGTGPNDTWTHLVAVLDGTSAYLYVNGIMEASKDNLVPALMTTYANSDLEWSTSISTQVGNKENVYFTGIADEVMFFDTPLNANQVLELYNR
ncbi:MAG: VWA domain-containing protein [Deltaproteobacteria bacterium]|nr:VWA domain-containing protein [Deltaproteobacteria bacterium]